MTVEEVEQKVQETSWMFDPRLYESWIRAVRFVRKNAEPGWRDLRILPGDDGSVDVHWFDRYRGVDYRWSGNFQPIYGSEFYGEPIGEVRYVFNESTDQNEMRVGDRKLDKQYPGFIRRMLHEDHGREQK